MIVFKNIDVSFGTTSVFRNLTASIDAGDFITMIGPNGAGKTTFFDVIAGKVLPQSGRIIIDGVDVTHQHEIDRAAIIARLFQNPRLNTVASMTVAENLALASLKGRRAGVRSAMYSFPEEVLASMVRPLGIAIDDLLSRPMGALSGGQRQIIALVMATLHPPKILLLDEPTAALDPQAATKMLLFATSFIRQHGITTILITHDQRLALTLGNKLWVLRDGGIMQFDEQEKRLLEADMLIGDVDYAVLGHSK